MSTIHPTAVVSKKASVAENVSIGPFAVIEDDVVIGEGCEIGPHAVLYNGARLGNRVKIKQSVSIAHVPQDLKFGNEKSVFIIGDDTVIHEFVTLHRGTKETGKSEIGKNCLLMAYTHVAHDCYIGDNCIIANGVQIAGHSFIEKEVTIGGLVGVHQFSRIGRNAMVGAVMMISQDVPPYILTADSPAHYHGLNVIGLKRRGFKTEDINLLKKAYEIIYSKSYNVSQAKQKIKDELPSNEYLTHLLNFLDKCKRGIVGK
jgi:UDP-N-acetylglucosamine acyltransferase